MKSLYYNLKKYLYIVAPPEGFKLFDKQMWTGVYTRFSVTIDKNEKKYFAGSIFLDKLRPSEHVQICYF